jgi:hypothetical protein
VAYVPLLWWYTTFPCQQNKGTQQANTCTKSFWVTINKSPKDSQVELPRSGQMKPLSPCIQRRLKTKKLFYRLTLYYYLYVCDCRRGIGWWIDLLTTYTHHSELQVIIAQSLISTLHRSPQHPLSLFPPAVSLQPFLRKASHALRSYIHSLPCRTQLSTDNFQAGGHFTATSFSQADFQLNGSPHCLPHNHFARTE